MSQLPVTRSVHIVRRYGLVGGMEAYVYHLTACLAAQGQHVVVWCESNECLPEQLVNGVEIVVLDNTWRKPRWLAQWGFSQQVKKFFQQADLSKEVIIHSHERTPIHHVTTFHGPPFLMRTKRLFDFLSPRIHMWEHLERQELLGKSVKAILPNSVLIADQLTGLYPEIVSKLKNPAYPGVDSQYFQIKRQFTGQTIGFLGKEWHRKGLDIACEVIKQLYKKYPKIHFLVAGCDINEVKPLFSDLSDDIYTLAGWVEPIDFFSKIDVLLHPARAEPFGMVIAEANAAGVPVVISDQCGAKSLVTNAQGQVCSIIGDTDIWVSACDRELNRQQPVEVWDLTWDKLALQHIRLYYELLNI